MSISVDAPSVLLVDPDTDSRAIVRAILEYAGYRVAEAADGGGALELARTLRPAAVVMEVRLSGNDPRGGAEVVRRLAADAATAAIPVVALTAAALPGDREAAYEAGFRRYLTKPATPREVLSELDHLLGRADWSRDTSGIFLDLDQQRAVSRFADTVGREGLCAGLAVLNERTPHRFTGVYRFDAPMLRNLFLYDREAPDVARGSDAPMEETYCSIVGRIERSFRTADTRSDPRLADHPARESVVSYCGVLLRDDAGAAFGTLCHFDHVARPVPEREVAVLSVVAPRIMREVLPG